MSTQHHEALRLAEIPSDYSSFTIVETQQAQAELRRLHALNAELLEALRAVDVLFGHLARDSTQRIWLDNAHAAIAKAEGCEV